MDATKTCVFTEHLPDFCNLDLIIDLVGKGEKVLSDRKGSPTLVRTRAEKGSSRWIINGSTWGYVRGMEPRDLKEIDSFIQYYGVGFKPTPGSLSQALARQEWDIHKLKKHTGLSISAEEFVWKNAVGGIVQTPGKGKVIPEGMMLDQGSSWLSKYVLHPTGTAVPFDDSSGINPDYEFFTYFAVCDVMIIRELPLGPFPYKTGKKEGKRVSYPTQEAIYNGAVLWKEQINDCHRAGCIVKISKGYGWREYTCDNFFYADRSYRLRILSSSDTHKSLCKRAFVAGTGSLFSPREQYYLVGEEEALPGDEPVNIGDEFVNLYKRKEIDNTSPKMPHWYAYTIMRANSDVYQFALPYAKEGRLVSIDYDSILIVEKDERHQFLARKDFNADVPPGTWMYVMLHNIHDIKDRSFKSDELNKTPGVPS